MGDTLFFVPISERQAMAMPLEEFSDEHRAEIEWEVAQPEPPERYWYAGIPGSPRPFAILDRRSWWEWHWQRGIDPDKQRESLPAWKRDRVIKRDGYVCGLCGDPVHPEDVHIDHIHPKAKGGSDEVDNLQVSHSLCNMRKGARI